MAGDSFRPPATAYPFFPVVPPGPARSREVPVEVPQVWVMEDEVEGHERDEEKARLVVNSRPGRPLHREEDVRPPAMPAGREGEKEDKGGDERREEQGKEDGFTTALTVPTRTALSTRILIINMPGLTADNRSTGREPPAAQL